MRVLFLEKSEDVSARVLKHASCLEERVKMPVWVYSSAAPVLEERVKMSVRVYSSVPPVSRKD